MTRFFIAAPFDDQAQIPGLKAAGADELYCGFVDNESEKRWPSSFYLVNRRARKANFTAHADLERALRTAHRAGMPVYVTFNGQYTEEQYPWLMRTIPRVAAMKGLTGIIVADVGLLLTLADSGYTGKICVSTGGTVFNRSTVDFFRSLGAARVVLDRQLTAREIRAIAIPPTDMEFEIFIFHSGCMFIDGYCAFFHCQDEGKKTIMGPGVHMLRRHYVRSEHHNGCQRIHGILKDGRFDRSTGPGGCGPAYDGDKYPTGCNLCTLFDLRTIPAVTLKVVGRGEHRFETIQAVRAACHALSSGRRTRSAYIKEARALYAKITGRPCTPYNCYCPTALIGKGG